MKNKIQKFKTFAVGLVATSVMLFAPCVKAGVVTLLPTGNTNIVANATTNLFSGTLIASCANAKELGVSFGFQMALTNTAAITLTIDTAILSATNVYGTFNDGGHWQTNVQTVTITALNNTNICMTNFLIQPSSPAGGMVFYRFSVGNASVTSGNYVTNLFLTTIAKNGL